MTKFKKTIFITGGALFIVGLLLILFISPLTKYLIQKYDEKYTGRQITLSWLYLNPFTGYIHISNLNIYEQNSDSVFFTSAGLSANFAIAKLFTGTYEISELTLDHPAGIIVQNKNNFNYNDLIAKFSTPEGADTTAAPVHFNILNLKIIDGAFSYTEEVTPINYSIKEFNFESTGKRWDSDSITGTFSALPGTGSGSIKGDFMLNFNSMRYRTATIIQKFDLNIIDQYLKDLTNYGSFSANLDADMTASGSFENESDITIRGSFAVNDFHFGKNKNDDYAAFKKFTIAINELSPLKHIYLFDSVSLLRPYFKYEQYDSLDNMETMFGKNGNNIKSANSADAKFNLIIEIGNYIKELSKNFFRSDYKVNTLAISDGNIRFNDYSISEKFSIGLDPLNILADSIDKNHKRVSISLQSGVQPFGQASVAISINPRDSSEFDMQYHFLKLPAPMFNPYLISFTSYPMDKGSIELNGEWKVRNGTIQSKNHLLIIDPRSTKRVKNKDTKWIPTWLILAFIRERGNVIDYEIPITGNLKDPKFHFWDVVSDALTNIFVKPVTTPYRSEVKEVETEIEKSLMLKWDMRHNTLQSNQERFIQKMAAFLLETPDASITVSPQQYALKEKEYILYFEAKKKYFKSLKENNGKEFTDADSAMVDKMSVKDKTFVDFLNDQVNDTLLFTLQDRCSALINPDIVNAAFDKLNTERKNAFLSYFINEKVQDRIKILPGENVIPKNGFSFFKIIYKGEYPEPLIKAYQKMNELNDESPRKEFKKERVKNGSTL